MSDQMGFKVWCYISRVVKSKDHLEQVCDVSKLPKFTKNDIELLTEHVSTMAPLAITLDQLHGDKSCYLGMTFPRLVALRHKLVSLLAKELEFL